MVLALAGLCLTMATPAVAQQRLTISAEVWVFDLNGDGDFDFDELIGVRSTMDQAVAALEAAGATNIAAFAGGRRDVNGNDTSAVPGFPTVKIYEIIISYTPCLEVANVWPDVTTGVLGDVNVDGATNFLDISPFIDALSAGTYTHEADVNSDGVVDFLDISPFNAILAM